ncbi:MAG: hypothetical protein M3R50_11725 [Bacteroidota bacterium]|nr:hypothetical protein [Bacteroidota bacterium]
MLQKSEPLGMFYDQLDYGNVDRFLQMLPEAINYKEYEVNYAKCKDIFSKRLSMKPKFLQFLFLQN